MTPNYQTLIRSMPVVDIEVTSKNELEALFVPYDVTTTVYDPGEPEPYQEGFLRGAFDLQLKRASFSPASVPLLPRHGSSETFGHTRKLMDTDKGLHGVVGIRPSLREDVEQMIADGIDRMSIEFHPLQRAPRLRGDTRWREHAVLLAVAMVPNPAYDDAKVIELRAEQDVAAMERAARIRTLEDEISELRQAGERWRS